MKEIKDYLHLYKYVMCVGKNGLQYKLHGTDENMAVIHERETGRVSITYAGNLQPILRPLSSMTQGEMNELWDSFGIDGLITVDIKSNEGEYMGTIPMQWNSYLLLLSKSFDLFGLIEAGLAIDATTLK